MPTGPGTKSELSVSNRKEWRSWLKKNHAKTKVIWLVYFKKNTGIPSINYPDSVEEALCFGWIDGLKKSIDEQKYAYRFTPRKSGSKWSPRNIKLAEKMIEDGKMTQAGLVVFNQRLTYDEKFLRARDANEIPLTSEIEEALRAHKKAWNNFINLAPGYKKQYIGWLRSAKKQETLERRIKEAIKLLAENKKLGMK
jgi:uncharacterized protein YdeI (YjbR/CyaY-like superfamily)